MKSSGHKVGHPVTEASKPVTTVSSPASPAAVRGMQLVDRPASQRTAQVRTGVSFAAATSGVEGRAADVGAAAHLHDVEKLAGIMFLSTEAAAEVNLNGIYDVIFKLGTENAINQGYPEEIARDLVRREVASFVKLTNFQYAGSKVVNSELRKQISELFGAPDVDV